MEIRHQLFPGASPKVRVDHIALNRPRADDRYFDDEIIETARLQSRQGIHLRAALDLENADRIGAAQIIVDRLIFHVEAGQIQGDAARLSDVEQAVLK